VLDKTICAKQYFNLDYLIVQVLQEAPMGRPPVAAKQRQLAVALPEEFRSRLEASAAGSGVSLAEEIRRRVRLSFEQDAVDRPTRDLLAAVRWIAEELDRQAAPVSWQNHPKANEALTEALRTWLEIIKPRRAPGGVAASDLMAPDDPPTLGRSIARHYQRFKSEMEKSEREIRELLKGEKR
jgi:hypothetical protein